MSEPTFLLEIALEWEKNEAREYPLLFRLFWCPWWVRSSYLLASSGYRANHPSCYCGTEPTLCSFIQSHKQRSSATILNSDNASRTWSTDMVGSDRCWNNLRPKWSRMSTHICNECQQHWWEHRIVEIRVQASLNSAVMRSSLTRTSRQLSQAVAQLTQRRGEDSRKRQRLSVCCSR